MTQAVNRTILVTGVNGQVGFELRRALQGFGRIVAADRDALDLASPASIRACIDSVRPDVIVNPAAYTAVDKAESEPEAARAINAEAPAVLAEEAKRLGALLVHYSTDYVFDGTKPEAYCESDETNPQNVYGATKLAGEGAVTASGAAHLIFRTSWVYGQRGRNFLLTMLKLAREREELRIVADQWGAPTWSATIAALTASIIAQGIGSRLAWSEWAREKGGLYHLTARDSTSWAGFAQAIFEESGLATPPRVVPIPSSEYPTPARRPANSRLDGARLTRAFGLVPPDWREALRLCLASN
ncbi:dTDP-4-dehydrorhamnose reductase [Caballeronia sp. LZ062]|uniref:dTDP-4-dehydrorhamnose reductase n=1 Tax=unclassified Caballeronia TaxID=2646786 RepID=UPI002858F7F2|nr:MULTISPECIES: dTDP-4-dehydrorhamnose reductase [unclassified Caballeronia]MDR5855212.1 dTDP-4-dehydrorhamnose reductase [Caballeronia sp. LZ050]MDR5870259.1 dTDP-4-dehydrorhamnose reductase [Caballeronia sp. LZ062]